ncbi:condensation domain-containing protein [Parafrankia elaeagni]|uniref:chromosome condensation protein n=1 Tax=Parafrankia elaeagni TaxID=222534 RepID=UPI001E2B0B27|nr:chromosome condensation protein [Parafrankia elaeagni]
MSTLSEGELNDGLNPCRADAAHLAAVSSQPRHQRAAGLIPAGGTVDHDSTPPAPAGEARRPDPEATGDRSSRRRLGVRVLRRVTPRARSQALHEDFILASDRSRSPLTVGVVAVTDSWVDASRLREAVYRTLTSHPIVSTRPTGVLGTFAGWEISPEKSRAVGLLHEIVAGRQGGNEVAKDPAVWRAVASLCSGPFDLRGEDLPLRVLLAHRPTGDVVGLVAHHVLLDGISALTLLQEILGACAPADPSAPRSDTPDVADQRPHRDLERPSPVPSASHPDPQKHPPPLPFLVRTVVGSQSATRPPDPDATPTPEVRQRPERGRARRHLVPRGPRRARGYAIHGVDLPVPAPVPPADGRRATVNDLLIAAAHLAVARWNSEQGHNTGTVSVRMALDATISARGDGTRTLGNWSGQAMITSSIADRTDPRTLLHKIVDQTVAAKQARDQWTGAGLMALITLILGNAPRSLRVAILRCGAAVTRPYLTPSIAVSNIGQADTGPLPPVPHPRIKDLSFLATNGMPQGVIICVAGNGDRLRLTFCHHRRLFDHIGVAHFADIYRESLDTVAKTASLAAMRCRDRDG